MPCGTDRDGVFASAFTEGSVPQIVADAGAYEAQQAVRHLLFDVIGLPRPAVTFHAGWFKETFAAYRDDPIAFAHVDADFYESTRDALEFLDVHMADRALVVLDDWDEWPGVRTAFEEHRCRTVRRLELQPGRGQAVVVVGDW